jgi:hypothetical protein
MVMERLRQACSVMPKAGGIDNPSANNECENDGRNVFRVAQFVASRREPAVWGWSDNGRIGCPCYERCFCIARVDMLVGHVEAGILVWHQRRLGHHRPVCKEETGHYAA